MNVFICSRCKVNKQKSFANCTCKLRLKNFSREPPSSMETNKHSNKKRIQSLPLKKFQSTCAEKMSVSCETNADEFEGGEKLQLSSRCKEKFFEWKIFSRLISKEGCNPLKRSNPWTPTTLEFPSRLVAGMSSCSRCENFHDNHG